MPSDHLRAIREYEIAHVIHYMHKGQRVLEIGSGAGWQAQFMEARGLTVISLEIPTCNHAAHQTVYDGKNFPLKSASVDVIYSSNVLEHIEAVAGFQHELHRVLKPGGCAIHVLPTPSWRSWTSLGFYLLKLRCLAKFASASPTFSQTGTAKSSRRHRQWLPERHGERGSSLTELFYFSRIWWVVLFRATGWRIQHIQPNHLFYTGYSLMDDRLSLKSRHHLSFLAGSACTIYVLTKK